MDSPSGPRRKPADRRLSDRKSEDLVQIARYAGLGTEFAVTIALCLFGGYWLDQRWSTTPLFTISGALLGMAGAFYSFYVRVTREGRGAEDDPRDGEDNSC